MSLSYLFLKYISPVISPTYLITLFLTKFNKNQKTNKVKIIRINRIYFYISFSIAISLYFIEYYIVTTEKNPYFLRFIFFIMLFYSFSRSLEIFLFYIIDSIEKMKYKTKPKPGISFLDKFILALRNYIELIFTYGIIYHILNKSNINIILFNSNFEDITEALYFSANTITLLGYGDHYPTHLLTQFLSMFQLISGAYILIITFTLYVTLNFANPNYLNSKTTTNKEYQDKNLIRIQIIIVILLIITIAFLLL